MQTYFDRILLYYDNYQHFSCYSGIKMISLPSFSRPKYVQQIPRTNKVTFAIIIWNSHSQLTLFYSPTMKSIQNFDFSQIENELQNLSMQPVSKIKSN